MSYDARNNWGAVIANEQSIRESSDASLGLARAEANLLAQKKRALQNEQSADDVRLIMQLSHENKKLSEKSRKQNVVLKNYMAQIESFKRTIEHMENVWGADKTKEFKELRSKKFDEINSSDEEHEIFEKRLEGIIQKID